MRDDDPVAAPHGTPQLVVRFIEHCQAAEAGPHATTFPEYPSYQSVSETAFSYVVRPENKFIARPMFYRKNTSEICVLRRPLMTGQGPAQARTGRVTDLPVAALR
ncbi:hypothetical protein J2X36_000358 [Methylobacterium sp. BE186]|uniref:hypothetical protein n=1 Tax=Methylobacterium sp. BE186 TaxID=2817715 RepID=UPI002863761A|nr:hypothetical protein [Methylobacterium sp. BE186]MDR7035623.1 hypothetical protein [Methylobacterium sp. BE186]